MEGKFQFTLAVIFLIFGLFWGGVRIYKSIVFEINCEGHLKRAADANTIKLAQKELEVAIAYMEEKNYTEGYTSILYRTPDEDVGFWYQNISASLKELEEVNPDATQLEKSNLLMKLRETLLDQGESDVEVTVPQGISIFPFNGTYCFWGCVSWILCVIFAIAWYKANE